MVWRPKRGAGKKVSFAVPLVKVLGEEPEPAVQFEGVLVNHAKSFFCTSAHCDPMLDEFACGVMFSEKQNARAAKIMQMLQAAQDPGDMMQSPGLEAPTGPSLVQVAPVVAPEAPVRGFGAVQDPCFQSEVPSITNLDEFLVSITRPLPTPVLNTCPAHLQESSLPVSRIGEDAVRINLPCHNSVNTLASDFLSHGAEQEEPITSPVGSSGRTNASVTGISHQFSAQVARTLASNFLTHNSAQEESIAPPVDSPGEAGPSVRTNSLQPFAQRASSRLANKAKNRTGKGALQIAEDLLVKKLNSLSPNKNLTELDVVEQLSQHFDRPLTKGKAEAIETLSNHGKQGKTANKKKKKVFAGAAVAPAGLEEVVA